MFIAKDNNLIILAKDTREELERALRFMHYTSIEETDVEYILYEGNYLTPDKIAQKEHERIQELSITKSDFFDATIKAFGLDGNDLLPIIANIINQAPVDEIMKKIALNNYQNAKDFYRKHEIFNAIVNVPLVISEQLTITLTAEQLDKFFDKASKKDPDAYRELLPQVSDGISTQGGEE